MASKAAPILFMVAKWLLVPAALGAVGYYVVGPQIGALPQTRASVDPLPADKDFTADPWEEEEQRERTARPEPEVEVKVRPAGTIRNSNQTSQPRRRRTTPRAPATTDTAPSAPAESRTPAGETLPATTSADG